jgi:hypothetical protein
LVVPVGVVPELPAIGAIRLVFYVRHQRPGSGHHPGTTRPARRSARTHRSRLEPVPARPTRGTLIQVAQADSKLVLATDLHADEPDLRQLDLTNATPPPLLNPGGSPVTPQLDDIERVSGRGVLYGVDQKTGDIWTLDTTNIDPGTIFGSQPAPSSGDQPNTPALAVVDLHTGIVAHIDSTLQSPKGLLFVQATTNGALEARE